MVTDLQKRAAVAFVNVFETGKVAGRYGAVTVVRGDRGHLTYGRSQATLASGTLYLLLKAYVETQGARYGAEIGQYLPQLSARDTGLDQDTVLKGLLRAAGDDPVMHEAQDAFFDRVYWIPATTIAASIGVETALGVAAIYDGCVHGSFRARQQQTTAAVGAASACGERVWIVTYLRTRRAWLESCGGLLAKTVYRMDSLLGLVARDQWDLELPVLDSLMAPLRVSGEDPAVRLLRSARGSI
jgi:chitosanase